LNPALIKFAETATQSGIGAFNINLKALIFQFVTFLIVLLVFKRWILPPLLKTLEARRKTVEESLAQAKQTEEALAKAQEKAQQILAEARNAADEALADAKKSATSVIAMAEETAAKRAKLIVQEAEDHLAQERDKLHEELRDELAGLVANATEKIIQEKLDSKRDMSLIERAIKGIAG